MKSKGFESVNLPGDPKVRHPRWPALDAVLHSSWVEWLFRLIVLGLILLCIGAIARAGVPA